MSLSKRTTSPATSLPCVVLFAEYQYIETVPRRGYRFTAEVKQVTVEDVKLTDRSGAETEVLDQRDHQNEQSSRFDSLAVLPFINAGADPEAEYLSDGITESIISNLSQLSGLRVMARSTVSSLPKAGSWMRKRPGGS